MSESSSSAKTRRRFYSLWCRRDIFFDLWNITLPPSRPAAPKTQQNGSVSGVWPLYSHSCHFKSRFFVWRWCPLSSPSQTFSSSLQRLERSLNVMLWLNLQETGVLIQGDTLSQEDLRGFLCFRIKSLLFCLCLSNKGSNGKPIAAGQSAWPPEPFENVLLGLKRASPLYI